MTATANPPAAAPTGAAAASDGLAVLIAAAERLHAARGDLGASGDDPQALTNLLLAELVARLDRLAGLIDRYGPVLDQLGRGPLAAILGARRKG